MRHRVLPLFLAVLALCLLTAAPTLADDKNTHEGTVVKAGENMLTMKGKAGETEHSHNVARDAKITCDGKDCKLEDLKKGQRVKVTVEKKDGKEWATKIEAQKDT